MTTEGAQIGITKVADVANPVAVRKAMFDLLELMQSYIQVPPNARVLIKVNLCLLLGSETGATVDPYLVRYLVEWLLEKRAVKEIVIAEADATHLNAELAFRILGWDQVLAGVPRTRFLNLSSDELVSVELDGLFFQRLEMSKTFMEADYLISFAKLKTHTLQLITGVMKNQWGALPEKVKIVYHPHLEKVICDLTKVRPPDFCLVDGLIAHEGAGPVSGVPRLMGLIVAGTDAVAVDDVCARLMGKDPRRVPYLNLAYRHRLGAKSYTTLGCRIEDVQEDFAFVPRWRQVWGSLREHLVKT
ncbi:MAG: DUF362 domain-containing protein [Chloroflexi bacterium]|nr:DUF362 domain-containing protein [Chloroflexota bacterium]